MAFESLSEKLNEAFKKLRGKGRLTENDVKEAMREVRMALLEADVSYKVVRDFTKSVTAKAVGADVLEALNPAQMVIKIVNDELCGLMGSENRKLNISSKTPSVVFHGPVSIAGSMTTSNVLCAISSPLSVLINVASVLSITYGLSEAVAVDSTVVSP